MQHRVIAFASLLAWCGALLVARVLRTGSLAYAFLVWNLFLAVIPAVAAFLLERARRAPAQIAWGVVWLAFFPNAPYLATDLLHLRARQSVPLWYDVALLLSCAITGLLLGYVSLADVQRAIAKRLGDAASWLCAATALLLGGFGIYLGRFLRRNSWEIATDPIGLFADVATRIVQPWAHPKTVLVTAVYGCGLLVGYVAFRMLSFSASSASTSNEIRR